MRRIRSTRAGILLDAILGLGVILLGAFALDRLGITLPQLLTHLHHFIAG